MCPKEMLRRRQQCTKTTAPFRNHRVSLGLYTQGLPAGKREHLQKLSAQKRKKNVGIYIVVLLGKEFITEMPRRIVQRLTISRLKMNVSIMVS